MAYRAFVVKGAVLQDLGEKVGSLHKHNNMHALMTHPQAHVCMYALSCCLPVSLSVCLSAPTVTVLRTAPGTAIQPSNTQTDI